jgi:transcription termination factor NusB
MDNQDLEKYAIKYLDNGGKYEDIPSKNSRIKKAVEHELKRRYMVYIRYEINKNKKFSHEILKIIKENKEILDNPQELYNNLNKLSFEKIKNLQKNILQHSKKKK